MIKTEDIEIKKINNLTSEYIEEQLKKLDIKPLRWAIVKTTDDFLVLSVSHEK